DVDPRLGGAEPSTVRLDLTAALAAASDAGEQEAAGGTGRATATATELRVLRHLGHDAVPEVLTHDAQVLDFRARDLLRRAGDPNLRAAAVRLGGLPVDERAPIALAEQHFSNAGWSPARVTPKVRTR